MSPRPPERRPGDPSVDDWLGEQGEVDWSDDPRSGGGRRDSGGELASTPRAEAGGERAVAGPGAPGRTSDDARRLALVQRRRAIGLVALLALALVGVGVGLTVLRDDAPETSTTPTAAATPPPATPPATPPAATPSPPAATTAPLTIELPESGRLAFGDRGEEVETLQTALAALDLDAGEADGIFGEATREAVIAFQGANDLTADGIVGPTTVTRLNAVLADQGVTG